ncbi:MAG: DnaD domain protein [Oscillospiraceae bacterium]|nr:DnaD domain protein [Oscillospiraceae bacterium]
MSTQKKGGAYVYHLKEKFDPNALPSALAEQYRKADGPALRAALFLLCEGGCADAAALAAALSMSDAVAARALAFWQEAGRISESQTAEGPARRRSPAPPRASARAALSSEDIGALSLRDPSVAALFQEAEAIVGRPLDTLESRMLAEIRAYDGLPVDVILTIVAYCAPRAKSNRKIIALAARTAGEWSEQGLCDPAQINDHIRLLERRERNEAAVAGALALKDKAFSRSAKTSIARWFEEYGYDIDFVKAANARLESSGQTVENPVAYINTILKGWYNSGYTSIKDTMERAVNVQPEAYKKADRGDKSMMKSALEKRRKQKEGNGSGI